MNESSFPFEQPAMPGLFADDVESDGGRRPRLLVGGLIAALVVGAGGFALVGGGSGVDELGPTNRSALAVSAPVAEAAPGAHVPEPNTEQIGRNPFKARYVEPPPPPPPPPAPVTPPAPVPVQVTIQAPTAPAAEPQPSEYPLTLVSVGDPQPEVRVVTWKFEGKTLEVLPGQRFGKYGELVVLAYATNEDGSQIEGVILQVGDASPFTVKLGETVKVL